ncbi:MAG: hypothetical protein LBO72_06140, partial [Helicobacteraceae bacterium]|nr:hypothetical protein [Helicobacteraceae bacterium]
MSHIKAHFTITFKLIPVECPAISYAKEIGWHKVTAAPLSPADQDLPPSDRGDQTFAQNHNA